MSEPRVTVAMPAFNAAPFIAEAIDSVLAQEFDSFELIVIDDSSTDRTADELRRFVGHSRVHVHRNTTKLGSGATRNRILQLARGEYFLPCDADDLLLPGALHHLSRHLDDHHEVGVVYGDILRLFTNANTLQTCPRVIGRSHAEVWDLHENVVNHGGSLIRTELMRRVGGYALGRVPDDWGLFLKLAELTRIQYLQGHLYYLWRVHERSQTQNPTNREDVDRLILETVERRRKKGANRI